MYLSNANVTCSQNNLGLLPKAGYVYEQEVSFVTMRKARTTAVSSWSHERCSLMSVVFCGHNNILFKKTKPPVCYFQLKSRLQNAQFSTISWTATLKEVSFFSLILEKDFKASSLQQSHISRVILFLSLHVVFVWSTAGCKMGKQSREKRGTRVEERQQGCDTWFTAISGAEAVCSLVIMK